jgi:Uma2 family endonuclease
LGRVWTDVGFRLFSDPDTVLAPDVAFVRTDRLPAADARGFYRGAPDLALEVLSPDDRPSEVRDKVADYLAAGTPMVAVVDPAVRTVTLHRAGASPDVRGEDGMLDFDPVITGFSVPVWLLFE